jgi:hypothetical protein
VGDGGVQRTSLESAELLAGSSVMPVRPCSHHVDNTPVPPLYTPDLPRRFPDPGDVGRVCAREVLGSWCTHTGGVAVRPLCHSRTEYQSHMKTARSSGAGVQMPRSALARRDTSCNDSRINSYPAASSTTSARRQRRSTGPAEGRLKGIKACVTDARSGIKMRPARTTALEALPCAAFMSPGDGSKGLGSLSVGWLQSVLVSRHTANHEDRQRAATPVCASCMHSASRLSWEGGLTTRRTYATSSASPRPSPKRRATMTPRPPHRSRTPQAASVTRRRPPQYVHACPSLKMRDRFCCRAGALTLRGGSCTGGGCECRYTGQAVAGQAPESLLSQPRQEARRHGKP